MLLLMLRQRWRSTLAGEGHGLAWQVANIALFVLALVAALAVIFGVMIGIWVLADHGAVSPKVTGNGTVVDVTVTTPSGTSPASTADQFIFSRK